MTSIRLGTLDHFHIVVPDREAAANWYERTLGFQRIGAYAAWADIEGGPLHISADGGRSGIALFQAWNPSEVPSIGMGAGFRVDASAFIDFAESLGSLGLAGVSGRELRAEDVVDFDLCFSFSFLDPYGNQLEVNCFERHEVQEYLRGRGIDPVRHW
jgi:catechol 2,3-dioxygenase-like lactoylglutathione lyase family enzyme